MKTLPGFSGKKGKFIVGLLSLLLACNGETQQNQINLSDPETASNEEIVHISASQFRFSEMELGQLTDHSFSSSIKVNGHIDVPTEGRATVSSYYGGYVKQNKLLTGQPVKKGQVLFVLENPEYIQMQQDFLEIKSQLTYLRSDFERQQALSRDNIASQKNFLKSESDYLSHLAMFEGLKKRLSLLDIDPESVTAENIKSDIPVYAPISGYITEVNAENGGFLSPSEIALSIINTDHIHLDLNIFEKDINSLKEGQKILFRLPDKKNVNYEAEVFLIGQSIHAENRMVNVHAHLKDESQNQGFVPGMYVEADIFVSEGSTAKALPVDAVVESSGQHFVLLKRGEEDGEMVFVKKDIKTGASSANRIEVLNPEDFLPSDEFLVKGAYSLIQ